MSDQVKTTDQVKEATQKANNRLEKPPDGPEVRNASKEQLADALDRNPNRTKGMTELAYKDGFVDSPDKRSMELEAIDSAGNKLTIDKTSTKRQKDICLDPHPTRMMSAMTPEVEAKIKAERQAKHEQISQSATLMAIEAGKNPAMQAVALGRKHADSLPADDPQKQKLTELSRELAAKYSPEMRARYEQFDGGTHKAIKPENLTNTPEGWLTALQKIAQLPVDKQLQVIGSGLMAGIEQHQHDERERAWGRLIGTVQGTGEVLQGLAKIADFGAACLLGDNERAGKMGEEFGAALGQTIVGGVRLFQAADQYLYNIGYTGDYAKPFQDVVAVGQKLDQQWSGLPPKEQERIKTKLITELVVSGAIGAAGASTIQKASKFTEVLDAVAMQAKELHAVSKPVIKKAAKAVSGAVDDLLQPVGDTGMGVRMPIPKDAMKDETKMLMSKADDLGGQSGKRMHKGLDATGKPLTFSEDSGIELATARPGQDKLWEQPPVIRGDDVHVGLRENLPSGTKTIDRIVFKDGIAESIKSIDPRLDSYLDPSKFRNKLNEFVHKMELYEGQPNKRAGFKCTQDQIEEKIIHLGIPEGALNPDQVKVLEEVGRGVMKYNQSLPVDKAPIKIKVTVLQ